MRFVHTVFILLLACSINSCSFAKTAYNNAPEALSWWLDNYFDFTRAQKTVLNPALNQLHDWHRQTQLPTYIVTLQDLKNIMAQPQITPNLACEKLDDMRASFSQIQSESIPIVIQMAPLLSDKQLQHFRNELDDRAIKWKAEWWQESSDDLLLARFEKMEDFSEKIYGNLSQSQQDMLIQKLSKIPFNPELSYNEILRRHNDVAEIVSKLRDTSLSSEQKTTLIKNGFERLQNSPNPEYQTYANQHKQNICTIIADLHASTDSKQKQHAQDWLQNYIDQFTSLTQVKSASN